LRVDGLHRWQQRPTKEEKQHMECRGACMRWAQAHHTSDPPFVVLMSLSCGGGPHAAEGRGALERVGFGAERTANRTESNRTRRASDRALHCTAQHSTALHCTALHCTALILIESTDRVVWGGLGNINMGAGAERGAVELATAREQNTSHER